MDDSKKSYKYLFLILFACLTSYTFLLRAAFYDESGTPKGQYVTLRVIGENLAGDYGAFRLLEDGRPPAEAYNPQIVSKYLRQSARVTAFFSPIASPMKSFILVPWLSLPYDAFFETWIFWGLFLFGTALYALFGLADALLLMFALPAAYLSFVGGGWGVYAAAAVILALSYARARPKLAGFFGALCIAEPIVFCAVLTAFIVQKRRKAAVVCLAGGVAIVLLAWGRYGPSAFSESFAATFRLLSDKPQAFVSWFAIFRESGFGNVTAAAFQFLAIVAVCFGGVQIFKRENCPLAVQNAYICTGVCVASPIMTLSDYGLLYAGVAFLLYDVYGRGFIRFDRILFTAAFVSVFFEAAFLNYFGASFQPVLAAVMLGESVRRSY